MSEPSKRDLVEATAKSLVALLIAIQGAASVDEITTYEAAIALHGRRLSVMAGDASLDVTLGRLQAEAPDADTGRARERIVRKIWTRP